MKKNIYSLFFYALTGLGISLTIKADIGVSSFNSLNLSLSLLSGIKIGTITSIINGFFILYYMALTHFSRKMDYFFQIISVYSLGTVINIFTYYLLDSIILNHYIVRLTVFTIGVCIAGFGTGMVLNLGKLSFPIEKVCQEIGFKLNKPFVMIRYSIDIACVLLSLLLTCLMKINPVVREGTLISLLLLSKIIKETINYYKINYPQI